MNMRRDITGGRGMDAVIETVGGGHNFDAAMDMVRSCGVVVLVAGYYEPLKVNLGRIVGSEAIVTGSNCYGYTGMDTDFDAAIELIASGKVDATKTGDPSAPADGGCRRLQDFC